MSRDLCTVIVPKLDTDDDHEEILENKNNEILSKGRGLSDMQRMFLV